jgi:hypothetical protein
MSFPVKSNGAVLSTPAKGINEAIVVLVSVARVMSLKLMKLLVGGTDTLLEISESSAHHLGWTTNSGF